MSPKKSVNKLMKNKPNKMGDGGAIRGVKVRARGSQVLELDNRRDGWSGQTYLTFLTFIRA